MRYLLAAFIAAFFVPPVWGGEKKPTEFMATQVVCSSVDPVIRITKAVDDKHGLALLRAEIDLQNCWWSAAVITAPLIDKLATVDGYDGPREIWSLRGNDGVYYWWSAGNVGPGA